MSDVAISSFNAVPDARSIAVSRPVVARGSSRLRVVQSILAVTVALCLTVPESEMRAKALKMGIVVKNLGGPRTAS